MPFILAAGCRRSPEPQARTPEAHTGQLGLCYTPLTRDAHTAISPDTVSLLCRAFEPTSVSKVTRWAAAIAVLLPRRMLCSVHHLDPSGTQQSPCCLGV